MTNFILIDGSYFVFFRFYACVSWWKLAHGTETMGVLHNNEEFVEKFRQLFVSKLQGSVQFFIIISLNKKA